MLTAADSHETASDEFRTYMMMLLVAAPVLIDARTSRAFLEQAQALGGEMVRALASARPGSHSGYSPSRLDDAVQQLKHASAPLVQVLDPRRCCRPRRPGQLTESRLRSGTARSRHTPSKRGTGSRAAG